MATPEHWEHARLRRDVTDEQLGPAAFRAMAEHIIGAGSRWSTGWRVRLGVKA